ncbi:hypothetical protein [Flaviflagellibacter deserti]|jgi:uncharacterized membrane protein|uniref:DUF1254 domain-containing protein n=1 Tax=Flaviflagellibacter deserti TaxID=2267266 RepID=A0ABV9YYA4_9HYPH
MRWFFLIATGLLIGGVLHIVSLLAVPVVAPRDAYSRVRELGPENTFVKIDAEKADGLPFLDPAFLHLACRFDLRDGPMRVSIPLASDYISASFYTRDAVAFFSLNDRSATGRILEIDLRDANDEASKATEVRPGSVLVMSPEPLGFVLVRALAPSPSTRKTIQTELARSVCVPAN